MIFTKDKITLSWDDVDSLTRNVADSLMTSDTGEERDNIHLVGVARGGLIPATMLSHITGFPMTSIHHSNRDADVVGIFGQELSQILSYGTQTVVFVDDICDTGRTNDELVELVKEFRPTCDDVEFVCLIEKYLSHFSVDVAGLTITDNRWIVYPWEV
jgi:hypoxanthine phosphoribosyltransferase